MAVVHYIEHDTPPLPLGPEMQALAQDRQEVGEDGTQPEPSDIAKAESE